MLRKDFLTEIEGVSEEESHWLKRDSFATKAIDVYSRYLGDLTNIRLLDIGCAQGREVSLFNHHGIKAEGVDANPEYLAAAVKAYPDILFSEGNIEKLPFSSNVFDAVFCLNVIFYTDPSKSLPEIERVLKPGGVGIVSLDQKIVKLEDSSIIHADNADEVIALFKQSEILEKTYGERVDELPWRHQHYFYHVVFRKLK